MQYSQRRLHRSVTERRRLRSGRPSRSVRIAGGMYSDPSLYRADDDSKTGLPRPVWLLGWVSLATDAATEAIYPLLPVFLTTVLHAGAASLGVIEGAAEAVNSLLKIWAGRLSDSARAKRPLVLVGYSISSFARPFIAITTGWVQVFTV